MSDAGLTRRALLTLRGSRASAAPHAPANEVVDDAFSSYALAYAQVNEARPFIADEARRHGIVTENRTELDILKDIFAKAHLPAE
jgi:hypothetical protein